MSTWRDRAAPIVRQAVRQVVGDTPPPYSDYQRTEVRRLLRGCYPFGRRELWPYKVWLDEIARQLGEVAEEAKPEEADPRQVELFEQVVNSGTSRGE